MAKAWLPQNPTFTDLVYADMAMSHADHVLLQIANYMTKDEIDQSWERLCALAFEQLRGAPRG